MGRVIVVGAGVVGLTCAVRLLEAGHRVDVVARDLPLETTSAVAAALWYPYRALPQDRVTAWAATSYAVFADLARDERTGVRMLTGTEVLRTPQPDPWWRAAVPSLDRETALPPGYADGWTFVSPVVDMPVHLRWLTARIEELGGTLTRMNLSALPAEGALVVDATGLGARHFGADPDVTPVRGQVVVLEQVGLERWTLDADGPTYVVPRSREIVVGGTAEEGEWSRTPDPGDGRGGPAPRDRARAGAGGRPGPAAQGRAASGPADGPARAGRRRDPHLRPRGRGRDPVVGLRRRRGGVGR